VPGAEPMGTDTSPSAKGMNFTFPASAPCCHKTYKLCLRQREGRRWGREGTRERSRRERGKKEGTKKVEGKEEGSRGGGRDGEGCDGAGGERGGGERGEGRK